MEPELKCECCAHSKPLNQPDWHCIGGSEDGPEVYCSIACFRYHMDQTCGCFHEELEDEFALEDEF